MNTFELNFPTAKQMDDTRARLAECWVDIGKAQAWTDPRMVSEIMAVAKNDLRDHGVYRLEVDRIFNKNLKDQEHWHHCKGIAQAYKEAFEAKGYAVETQGFTVVVSL